MTAEKTIMIQINDKCDDFVKNMKDEKQKQGKTNQEIADATGIPLSNISKFFSGNLSNPGVFNAAAVCIYLGVSLDELFGIKGKSQEEELKALKAENQALKHELEFNEKLIATHEESIRSARSACEAVRMVLFCAIILIVTLMIIFSFYITYDAQDPESGFYQHGSVTPTGLVVVGTALIALYVFVLMIKKIVEGRSAKNVCNVFAKIKKGSGTGRNRSR